MAWRNGRKRTGAAEGFGFAYQPGRPRRRSAEERRASTSRRPRSEASPPQKKKARTGGRGKGRSLIGRLSIGAPVLALWARHRARRRRRLGRRPSAADPVARNSQAAAVGPDRRAQRRDAGDARRHGRRRGAVARTAATTCPRRSSRSRTGASIRITASIRWASCARVVDDVLRRGAAQGGSTITQQLAKNLFLTQERTVTRKLQEVVLALWLEHKFSKAQILELYLNRVYFGAGAYGVEGGRAALFRQVGAPVDARGSGDAGGACAIALASCAEPQSRRRRAPRPRRARRHGGRRSSIERGCGQARAAASRRTRSSRRPPARSTTSPTG